MLMLDLCVILGRYYRNAGDSSLPQFKCNLFFWNGYKDCKSRFMSIVGDLKLALKASIELQ